MKDDSTLTCLYAAKKLLDLYHGAPEEDYYYSGSRRRLEPRHAAVRLTERRRGFSASMPTDPAAAMRAYAVQFLKHALLVCCSMAIMSEAGKKKKKKTGFYQLLRSTRSEEADLRRMWRTAASSSTESRPTHELKIKSEFEVASSQSECESAWVACQHNHLNYLMTLHLIWADSSTLPTMSWCDDGIHSDVESLH